MRPANLDNLGFRFKIGDVAIHKGLASRFEADARHKDSDAKATRDFFGDGLKFLRLVVTERLAQECPGGVQLKYAVTGCHHDGNISKDAMWLLEEELAPLPA